MRTHDIHLPRHPRHPASQGRASNLTKWAVIACDQYTSEPEYWTKAADLRRRRPLDAQPHLPRGLSSTRRTRTPGSPASASTWTAIWPRTSSTRPKASSTSSGPRRPHPRKGLVACLDLEQYDFRKGATSLIRATEGTIIERIPPRVRIREGAPLESPHIMVLIDDPAERGPRAARRAGKDRLKKVYDFELMLGSGHLTGCRVEDRGLEKGVLDAPGAAWPIRPRSRRNTACRPERPSSSTPWATGTTPWPRPRRSGKRPKPRRPDKAAVLALPAPLGPGRARQPPRRSPGLRAHPPRPLRDRRRTATSSGS